MTPLQDFAYTMTEARNVFNAGHGVAAWLVLYNAKEAAYAKLVAALPQVKEIKGFWRYVQNMPSEAWLPVIEREILHITHTKHLCRDCGGVTVTCPERLCAQCQKARRLETYQKAKQRARVKQRYVSVRFVRSSRLSIRAKGFALVAKLRPAASGIGGIKNLLKNRN